MNCEPTFMATRAIHTRNLHVDKGAELPAHWCSKPQLSQLAVNLGVGADWHAVAVRAAWQSGKLVAYDGRAW